MRSLCIANVGQLLNAASVPMSQLNDKEDTHIELREFFCNLGLSVNVRVGYKWRLLLCSFWSIIMKAVRGKDVSVCGRRLVL